jgi:hypothetical protein
MSYTLSGGQTSQTDAINRTGASLWILSEQSREVEQHDQAMCITSKTRLVDSTEPSFLSVSPHSSPCVLLAETRALRLGAAAVLLVISR